MTAKVSTNGAHHKTRNSKTVTSATTNVSNNKQTTHCQFQDTSVKPEVRRANKPLMEKRRRARINQSLAMLKTLILDSAKMDKTKHTKLEKADILELTVRYFQRHRSLDNPGLNKYKAGYSDCVREIQRYLDTPDAQTMTLLDQNTRKRLIRHLDACVSEIDVDISSTVAPVALDTLAAVNNPIMYTEAIPQFKKELLVPENSVASPGAYKLLDTTSSSSSFVKPPLSHHSDSESSLSKAVSVSENLEADSSTTLEEINNNTSAASSRVLQTPRPVVSEVPADMAGVQRSFFQMPDGNLIFILPSHYLQIAAALENNLNGQKPPNGCPDDLGDLVPATATCSASSSSKAPVNVADAVAEDKTNGAPQMMECERPLDFSKNNEMPDSMWRPW